MWEAPQVPVKLSRRVARFNRAINNPIQRQYAWLLPPWVIIAHRGRRSGRLYRTPVNAYKRGRTLTAVILYGEGSDWVQNVLAGGGQVVRPVAPMSCSTRESWIPTRLAA